MEVFGMNPVNREAAMVTSQSGCASDDTLSPEQSRENLVAIVKSLEAQIVDLPKGSRERKRLGQRKARICAQINSIRPKKKTPGVEKYILDILREDLSAFEWDRLFKRAIAKMQAEAQ